MVMVNRVKKVRFSLVFLVLGILLIMTGYPQAQRPGKTITILYTNNINGEIDPCPT